MDSYISKKRKEFEVYEEYWKITAAWTDIFGTKFNDCLRLIVDFIDKNKIQLSSVSKDDFKNSKLYSELQEEIVYVIGFKGDDATLSARKAINTYVKLGFIEPFLSSYHKLTRKFLLRKEREEKRIIFSKIFYEKSSLCSSVTERDDGPSHIKFFLRTLDRNGKLDASDIKALMVTNIANYPAGFLTRSQLNLKKRLVESIGFEERKYNQISHLKSFLKSFIDVKYIQDEDCFYFSDNPDVANKSETQKLTRDPIRYRIFRNELLAESRRLYGAEVCYLSKKQYKGLVASHIKPSAVCIKEGSEDAAYDVNNGLLLNQNADQYFDNFEITFDDDGKIIVGPKVSSAVAEEYNDVSLDKKVMNESRVAYMQYHRKVFYDRGGK
ncbi:MAG: HNH endonuclease signature motif containing protein [Candidatus Saccharibacteria bacterium]|nr:HNH endonuclease signature motif containing protein [Candidatus Saccharibacteria bacterium]